VSVLGSEILTTIAARDPNSNGKSELKDALLHFQYKDYVNLLPPPLGNISAAIITDDRLQCTNEAGHLESRI
jgi:hypothetical protein